MGGQGQHLGLVPLLVLSWLGKVGQLGHVVDDAFSKTSCLARTANDDDVVYKTAALLGFGMVQNTLDGLDQPRCFTGCSLGIKMINTLCKIAYLLINEGWNKASA